MRPLTWVYPDLVENRHVRVLRAMIWVLLVGAAIFAAWVVLTPGQSYWRLYVPVAQVLLALSTHLVLHARGAAAAIKLLVFGGWTLATIAGATIEGVRTPMLTIYPVIVVFSGLLIGLRFAAGVGLASGVAVAAITLAQTHGWMHMATPLPPEQVAFALLLVIAISYVTTVYLERSFGDSYMLYRMLTESIKDVVWVLDVDTLRFRYVSPSVTTLRGFSAEEVMAAPLAAIFTADKADAMIARIRHGAENFRAGKGQTSPFSTAEIEQSCKDGSSVWTEVVDRYFVNPANGRLELLGVARDISERKRAAVEQARLEEELRASQKMEALGVLAGGLAHEFNNVLAMILGNVKLAQQDVGAGHAANESLEEIGKAGRRAKDLVQQILVFSQKQEVERKPTTLALVVVETARLLRASIPANVELKVECSAAAPAVLADATQVKQILMSLCGNALHAVRDQGQAGVIEIRLARVEKTGDDARPGLRQGVYACLTVSDNGVGMDAATRARAFDPFFTTRRAGEGSGLGLAVVHGIARAHEALVSVESSPGRGSAFHVYFPAIAPFLAPAAIPDRGDVQDSGRHAAHILLVDDEEGLLFLMRRLLERKGYRVSTYSDPAEALAAVRAGETGFDLVVTDYSMPRMSGLDLANALREARPHLPVVLCSGYITETLRAKAPGAGIRELIYKPNTVDELCEAIAGIADAGSAA